MTEGRKISNKALHKGLAVQKSLLSGEILEWKSLDEVAAAAGVTRNEAFQALGTLEEFGWVEKSARGFRAAASGLATITAAAQECLTGIAARWGLK
jgi:DNA-binding IclR family transcriptional regulator